jgi:hypothetical protein
VSYPVQARVLDEAAGIIEEASSFFCLKPYVIEGLEALIAAGWQVIPPDEIVPTLDGEADPRCPHGCRKTKPMGWHEDQFRCPKCGDEWTPDERS